MVLNKNMSVDELAAQMKAAMEDDSFKSIFERPTIKTASAKDESEDPVESAFHKLLEASESLDEMGLSKSAEKVLLAAQSLRVEAADKKEKDKEKEKDDEKKSELSKFVEEDLDHDKKPDSAKADDKEDEKKSELSKFVEEDLDHGKSPKTDSGYANDQPSTMDVKPGEEKPREPEKDLGQGKKPSTMDVKPGRRGQPLG